MPGKLFAFAMTAKKKYGGVVGRADITPSDDRRLPSGSISLDYALGGGYRVGWITTLYGKKSGGKTTTAIRGLALSQNRCRNCYRMGKNVEAVPPTKAELAEDPEARWSAKGECDCYLEGLYRPDDLPKEKGEKDKDYKDRIKKWRDDLEKNSYEEFVCGVIDPEGTFDKAYAATIGLDNRRVLYIRPESAEEGIDLMHALVCTVEIDMMMLDSIAQLVPTAELTESMTEWQQGLHARLMNKAVRKLVSGSSMVARQHRAITQLWINQERVKIGTMFGDPTVKPGGMGQEFAVCSEIKFGESKVEHDEEVYGSKDKKEIVRVPRKETFFFKVTKDKTKGMKTADGHYTQSMRANDSGPMGRVIEEEDIFKRAIHYLAEQDKKSKKYLLCGVEFSTQKSILSEIRNNQEFLAVVKEALLKRMLRGTA